MAADTESMCILPLPSGHLRRCRGPTPHSSHVLSSMYTLVLMHMLTLVQICPSFYYMIGSVIHNIYGKSC